MNILIKTKEVKYVFINPKIQIELYLKNLFEFKLKINDTVFILDYINSVYDLLEDYLLQDKNISFEISNNRTISKIYPYINDDL
jgi:uncharacterized protein YpiB (UPF0302 family)